jgi:hypothetical protein
MVYNNADIHTIFPVGMICSIGQICLGNPEGSLAVVYEQYSVGHQNGVSIMFPNGKFDGFSVQCMEIFGVCPVRLSSSVTSYQFQDVIQLSADFKRGIFDKGFIK